MGMNSIGTVLRGDQVGPEFRHDNNWILAAQLAGERDGREDLADVAGRLAKEGDEASRLGLLDRIGQHIDDLRRRIDRRSAAPADRRSGQPRP